MPVHMYNIAISKSNRGEISAEAIFAQARPLLVSYQNQLSWAIFSQSRMDQPGHFSSKIGPDHLFCDLHIHDICYLTT